MYGIRASVTSAMNDSPHDIPGVLTTAVEDCGKEYFDPVRHAAAPMMPPPPSAPWIAEYVSPSPLDRPSHSRAYGVVLCCSPFARV